MRNGQCHTGLLRATAMAFACSCALPLGAAPAKVGVFGDASVTAPGSPYRYTALSPRTPGDPLRLRRLEERLTVIVRTDTRDGRIGRWWHLRGGYQLPVLTYDGSGDGISADGGTLVLSRFSRTYPPRTTHLAILDTRVDLSFPRRAWKRPRHAITRVNLADSFTFHAISPDGSTLYLAEHLSPYVGGSTRLRALATNSGKLRPIRAIGPSKRERRTRGMPAARATSPDGRWAYTLYAGYKTRPGRLALTRRAFVHALNTVTGHAHRVELPQLQGHVSPFDLALRLEPGGRELTVLGGLPTERPSRALVVVDTERFEVVGAGATELRLGPPAFLGWGW